MLGSRPFDMNPRRFFFCPLRTLYVNWNFSAVGIPIVKQEKVSRDCERIYVMIYVDKFRKSKIETEIKERERKREGEFRRDEKL